MIARQNSIRVNLEKLETRVTPALLPGLAGVHLEPSGDLILRTDDTPSLVTLDQLGTDLRVRENNAVTVATFPLASVKNSIFYGGQADDRFNNYVSLPCTAYGYSGDDTLVGNVLVDKLFGGPGNDLLNGVSGPDFMIGGEGVDVCLGGGVGVTVDNSGNNVGVYGVAVEGGSSGSKIDLYMRGSLVYVNCINPFPGFNGSIHTDWGDVTGDGVDDIIAGSGSGSPNGHVVVYDGFQLLYGDKGKADLQFVSQGGAVRASLYAFVSYTSGVAVRLGDLNNDNFDDLILAPSIGAGQQTPAHLRVWDGRMAMKDFEAYTPLPYNYNWEIASFYAFGDQNSGGGGLSISVLRQNGTSDLVIASRLFGPGSKVFQSNPSQQLVGGKYLTGAPQVLDTETELTSHFSQTGQSIVGFMVDFPLFGKRFYAATPFDVPGSAVTFLDEAFTEIGYIPNASGQRLGLVHGQGNNNFDLLISSKSSSQVKAYKVPVSIDPPPTVLTPTFHGDLTKSQGISAWT